MVDPISRFGKLKGFGKFLVGAAGVLGFVVSGYMLLLQTKSQTLGEKTYDRTAGKMEAVIAVRGSEAAMELSDEPSLLHSKWGVHVKNIGQEPVEMVRVSLTTQSAWSRPPGATLNFGLGDGGGTHPVPQRDEFEHFDVSLLSILQPNEETWIDLKKLVLTRLSKLDLPVADEEFFIIFRVGYNGKLVGYATPSGVGGSYVIGKDGKQEFKPGGQSFSISWRPSRLTKKTLTRFVEQYHPAPSPD
jgi:hypothetical protein